MMFGSLRYWARYTALAAALWLTALSAGPAAAQESRPILLEGATVIDGIGGSTPLVIDIHVEGREIAAMAPDQAIRPRDAERIDLTGKWIIPGLIDAHVHLFQSGSLYTRPDIIDLRAIRPYETEIAEIRQGLDELFRRYLLNGITGIVDMGGPVWTVAARADEVDIPYLATAGPLLGTVAPEQLAIEDPPVIGIATVDDAIAAVKRLALLNVDLIKIWFVVPWGESPESHADWVRAAIGEAHDLALTVAVHATEQETARLAVAAGADILVHSIEDSPITPAFLSEIKDRGVIYIPTLAVYEGYWKVLAGQPELSAADIKTGDPAAIASFDDLADLPGELVPSWIRRAIPKPEMAHAHENLRRIHASGIPVAAGSDAGNIGTLHGSGLYRELILMVEAGLTPMAVLTAATRGGAAVMGREETVGTLAPGKQADLVILNASPLADIRNVASVYAVMKAGKLLWPADLAAGLPVYQPAAGSSGDGGGPGR